MNDLHQLMVLTVVHVLGDPDEHRPMHLERSLQRRRDLIWRVDPQPRAPNASADRTTSTGPKSTPVARPYLAISWKRTMSYAPSIQTGCTRVSLRRGHEASELPFKKLGERYCRAILKIGPDDLHAYWQARR